MPNRIEGYVVVCDGKPWQETFSEIDAADALDSIGEWREDDLSARDLKMMAGKIRIHRAVVEVADQPMSADEMAQHANARLEQRQDEQEEQF